MSDGPTLRIAALQPQLRWQYAMPNMVLLRKLVEDLPKDVDVAVLPETWPGHLASDAAYDPDQAITFLKTLARAAGVTIIGGGIAVPGPDGRLRNRVHVMDPTGAELGHYDKQALFAREQDTHAAGTAPAVFTIAGYRVGVLVCADLWHGRLVGAMDDVDVVCVCAKTTVLSDTHVDYARALWHSLALTRAMEYGVPIVVSDWPSARHTPKDIDASVGGIHGRGTTFDRGVLYKPRRAPIDSVPREPTALSPSSAAPALGANVHYTAGAATICNPAHRPQLARIQRSFLRGEPGVLIETIDRAAVLKYRAYRRGVGLLSQGGGSSDTSHPGLTAS